MKHLPLYNPEYKALLKDFKLYLQRLGYNKSSQSGLPSALQEFFHLMEKTAVTALSQITSHHITAHYHYLNERPNHRRAGGLSSSMISHHLFSLKLFFSHQQQSGKITVNPLSGLTFPSPHSCPRDILTMQEIKQLYAAAETLKDRAILALFYGCALRRKEAEKLNTTDLHYRSGLLYVREGKGMKRRAVPLSNSVAEDLKNYHYYERPFYNTTNQQAFILNTKGRRMSGDCCNTRVKELLKKAHLPDTITLHSLRHSIATHLLQNGLKIEKVRDFLGHSRLESTQLYTRISQIQLSSLHD